MQIWLLINPGGNEHVELNLFLEFLKILYDPYVH